jgi:hypothetical protein
MHILYIIISQINFFRYTIITAHTERLEQTADDYKLLKWITISRFEFLTQ